MRLDITFENIYYIFRVYRKLNFPRQQKYGLKSYGYFIRQVIEDVDFAEVHDCFTIAEVLRVEGLGLCERGGMVRMIRAGDIEINGKKPINASGGLLGKGHPLGATGVAQIYELTKQLRNEAKKSQIAGTRIGLR